METATYIERRRELDEMRRAAPELFAHVDLLVTPQLAAGDQIVALPTLVRYLPPPLKRLIGNLSDTERVLVGLDIRPKSRAAA